MSVTFFAIAGASGSGKTLFAQTLLDELGKKFPNRVAMLHEDAYYKDQSQLVFSEREKQNYDHPKAFDHDLLAQHLDELNQHRSIESPVYDYSQHTRSSKITVTSPADIFLVEGILLLQNKTLRDLFNYKIFIDTPLDICFGRRLRRDMAERGRSMESVMTQYHATVRPMFFEYVQPSRQWADIIVPHGGKNRAAIDMVKCRIEALLV